MILADEASARRWFADDFGADVLALDRLERFAQLLRAENQRQNLVSEASLSEVWTRHFADSAQLLRFVPRETPAAPWLDLGSGAGFPGLVVAICRPDWPIVMIESRAKRIAWLKATVEDLGLAAQVCGRTLEAVDTIAASVISARAFAPLDKLVALSARFSTPSTTWLLPKGRSGRQELAGMKPAIQNVFHVEQSLTDAESVILVGRGLVRLPRKKAT